MDARAERWLSTIAGIVERRMRVSFANDELRRGPLEEVAHALDEICQLTEESHAGARDVLAAYVPLIIDPTLLERVASLRTTAQAATLLAVSRLLRCSTPEGHQLDEKRIVSQEAIIQRGDGRPLSLGERRALARQPTRANLEKLMRDPHPMVVHIVLRNPRVTEDDVMRMAAHRPASPEIIVEIGKAWCHHPRVRQAIVFNPGAPRAVALPLLTLMNRVELLNVSRAADLANVLRATANDLWGLRPPMPRADPPELKH
jgi:hypothetical protein